MRDIKTSTQQLSYWLKWYFVIPRESPGTLSSISKVTKPQRNQTTATLTSDLSKKFYIQSLENKYKEMDLLVQILLNDMTLD